MAIDLPPLPYERNGLAPHISEKTIDFHYGKHHQAYVNNLNTLTVNTELADKPLEEIIAAAAGDDGKAGLFNNAAQVWNHTFFWNSMKPGGGGTPSGELAQKIDAAFGNLDGFKEQFKKAAATRFGSGWAWLVVDGGNLRVTSTVNADLPLAHGQSALLTIDVWEHAYYLDYQNRRSDYIDTFLNELVNWDFAAENLAKA